MENGKWKMLITVFQLFTTLGDKWVKVLGLPRDSCCTYFEDTFDFYLGKKTYCVP
ncbi:hypothetical protein Syun_025569 [Stephania yunnanensis]|uniref:Uncharacterized protein n=1 Tax=Stephania yunnanensis TaxID=152371 RepID=A0AAP0ESE2_9MAGN